MRVRLGAARATRGPWRVRVGAAALALVIATAGRAAAEELGGTGLRTITLLHVSDLHAQLEPHPDVVEGQPGFPLTGGFARLRSVLDRERSRATGAVITVDGGDDFHGSGPAAWSRGEVVVRPLRALGFDVGIWGDGDLAYGAERFRELARRAGFRRIGDAVPGDREGGFPRWVTVHRGGVTVGIVGITSPAPDPDDLARVVAELRGDEQAEVVVAVIRGGIAAARSVARDVPGIDVVLSSQAHAPRRSAVVEGGTLVVAAGALGSSVGRLDLALGPRGVESHAFRLVPVDAGVPEDPATRSLVNAELAPFRERMRRVVGRTATPIVLDGDALETSADNLVTDAIREVAGTQVAFAEGLHAGVPIPPGPVTEGQLWDLVPADAPIRKGWATGRQLREFLERRMAGVFAPDPWRTARPPRTSGLEVAISAAGLRRVWSVEFAAAPVRHYDAYTIAACARPGDTTRALSGIPDAQGVTTVDLTLHDALRRYLANHPLIRPRKDQRVAATDRPDVAAQGFASFQSRSSSW